MNSEFQQENRARALSGIRPEVCSACWRLEDEGMKSQRNFTRAFVEEQEWQTPLPFGDWDEIGRMSQQQEEWRMTRAPHLLEVMLSDACDMKCLYCGPHYSTSWRQELVKFGDLPAGKEPSRQVPEKFESSFWEAAESIADRLSHLSLIGGEPLLGDKLQNFLIRWDQVYQKQRSDQARPPLVVSFVTNLNCSPTKLEKTIAQLSAWSSRYEFEINVSMESFGARAEYIRYGLNWSRWLANFDRLVGSKIVKAGVSLQMATNVLSLTSLKDLLQTATAISDKHQQPIQLRQNIVSSPLNMAPRILTADFCAYVEDCARYLRSVQPRMERFDLPDWSRWDTYADFLETFSNSLKVNLPDPAHRASFFEFIQKIDERRGTDFLSVFPEYKEFHQLCSDARARLGQSPDKV